MDRQVKGILGTKVGMTQVWDENGRSVPVTVVQAGPNVVSQIRTPDKDGYAAVQLAFGDVKLKSVTKPLTGHFEKAGVAPRRHLVEIRTSDSSEYELGQEVKVDTFEQGELIDVTGTSKGKGFAGVMKRHGFAGQPASHGAHRVHRAPGAIGGCATPGRVFKGMRMPGRMGHNRRTVQNLTVQGVDTERNLVLIKGAVPGPKGATVLIRSAVKAGA
ncbi:50S ribosomal protein L3 [Natronoglycomyces albus]|uniref:Large ribosomal subunit protein uL3 n=1 Tax=Natronoglycomyces albus TaxID=2811108 RepID=A0A895XFB6_9ACTN|nr:50S ribosomal protein L3 [Natronoglycomyces albus]QSB04541.1 50S ribosomal protein L3 [Natronoglycomyces albus]